MTAARKFIIFRQPEGLRERILKTKKSVGISYALFVFFMAGAKLA